MKYFDIEYIHSKKENTKTLIMLHGWGCNKEIYAQYLNSLLDKFNIYIFDLYGFGQSKSPKLFFDTYEYALQIYLFLKSKNIKSVSILAHSFGGRLAIILSSCFDIFVEKMLLTGCAGLKPKRNFIYYYKIYKYKIIKKLFKKNVKKVGSVDYQTASDIMKHILVKVVNQNLEYLLNEIRSKVYLIWGRNDKDTPMYMCNKLLKNIANSNVFVIGDAEHFCLFTHMYLCKNKVRDFLIYD